MQFSFLFTVKCGNERRDAINSGILVAHGMRSIASTALNEQGFDPDVIEAALAHVGKDDVRNAYNRAEYLERRKKLMIHWSNYIDKATTKRAKQVNNIRKIKM